MSAAETKEAAFQAFDSEVRTRLPKGRTPTWQERQQAVAATATANPKLHQRYLHAMNGGKFASRILSEKYEDVTG